MPQIILDSVDILRKETVALREAGLNGILAPECLEVRQEWDAKIASGR